MTVSMMPSEDFTLEVRTTLGSIGGTYPQGSVIFAGSGNFFDTDVANFFWDDANNRLGIGNAAPGFTLDVTGTTRITGAVTLGTALTVPNGGTGAATLTGFLKGTGVTPITAQASIVLTTDVSGTLPVANGGTGIATLTAGYIPFGVGTSAFGSDSGLTWNNTDKVLSVSAGTTANVSAAAFVKTADTGGTIQGIYVRAARTAANVNSNYGIWAQVTHTHTSGVVGGSACVQGWMTASGNGGTTSFIQGFTTGGLIDTGAVVSDLRHVFINDITGAGTLTTQYGLYIATLAKGSANWAIYSQGSATNSYHAGKFLIGTTTPTASPLLVNGTIEVMSGSGGVIKFQDGTTQASAAAGGGTVNGTGTAGRGAFWTASNTISSDALFLWDNTNKYLGIGGTPTMPLDVIGTVQDMARVSSSNTTQALLAITNTTTRRWSIGVQGTAGTPSGAFSIYDNSAAAQRLSIDTNGRFTMSRNTLATLPDPAASCQLHVAGADSGNVRILQDAFGNSCSWVSRASSGTAASPSQLTANQEITRVSAFGYGSTAYSSAARAFHNMNAAELFTDAAQGTYQEWHTTAVGTTFTAAKMRLDGKTLWVGNTPTGSPALEVDTTSGKVNGVVYAEAYGAKADASFNVAGSMTASSGVLTLSGGGGSFASTDVGKTIVVPGAAAASGVLITTIASYTSSTQVTLTATATTTTVNAKVYWGTDSTTAFQNAVNTMGSLGMLQLRPGRYLLNGAVTINGAHSHINGAGSNTTTIYQASPTSETFKRAALDGDDQFTNMGFEGPGAGFCSGASSAISWASGAGPYFSSLIENVAIREFYHGVYLPSSPSNATELILRQVSMFSVGGYGIYIGTASSTCSLIYNRGLIFAEYRILSGLGITSGLTALTGSGFSAADIGKRITIQGAGGGGGTLMTTVVSVQSTTAVTVANAASTTVGSAAGAIAANMTAGIYLQGSGYNITDVGTVGGRYGMHLAASSGNVISFGFAHNFQPDSPWESSLYMQTSGTGVIQSHTFTNCWFASAGNWSGNAYSGSGLQNGVTIYGGASSIIQISFVGSRFINNRQAGISVTGGKQIMLDGCVVDGSSLQSSGTYSAIYIDTCVGIAITGNEVGHQYYGAGSTDQYSVNLAANVTGTANVSGNTFRNFNTAGTPILNNSGLGGNALVIANNAYA